MKTFSTIIATAALLGLAASAPAAELEIQVQGLASGQGEVLVAVFSGPDNWLRKPVAVAKQPAAGQRDGTLTVLLKEVPEGLLAVSVIHDLNGNGRLDMNAMGMPQEPFAFSNKAGGQFGPPRFEQAGFELKGASARIAIKLD